MILPTSVVLFLEEEHMTDEELKELSEQFGFPIADPTQYEVIKDFLTPDQVWRFRTLPIKLDDTSVFVITDEPGDIDSLDSICHRASGRDVGVFLCSPADLESAMRIHFPDGENYGKQKRAEDQLIL